MNCKFPKPNPYNRYKVVDDKCPNYHNSKIDCCVTNVEEPNKIAEIRDSYGNLRYKVQLTTISSVLSLDNLNHYVITVINCFSGDDETVIVKLPRVNEPDIISYDLANHRYHDMIDRYRLLVQSETKDVYDMSIYSHKTGYQMTTPECCETCKWCQIRRSNGQYIVNETGRLECINPKNQNNCDFTHDHHLDYDRNHNAYCDHSAHKRQITEMHPIVDAFGKCPNYQPRKEQLKPIPGENLIDILNSRIEFKYENTILPTIETERNRAISAEQTLLSANLDNFNKIVECSAAISAQNDLIIQCSVDLSSRIDSVEESVPDSISTILSTTISTDVIKIVENNVSTVIIPNISAIIQEQVVNHMPILDGNQDLYSALMSQSGEVILMSDEGA